MVNKILTIAGVVILVVAVIAAAGLGVWGYQLNTKISSTQKQIVSLQGDYDKLKADNAQLTTNLSTTNATLDKNKSDLAKIQADLKSVNSDIADERTRINKAKKLTDVAISIFVKRENVDLLTNQIGATGDAKLIASWFLVISTPTQKHVKDFSDYLFESLSDAVK
jgi:septal ring factor EnvC (AmiA/AmiB activator)